MIRKSFDQLYEGNGALTTEALKTYREEEDKLSYATMRFLSLFFQRGIDLDLDHNYLDLLSNNLEKTCSLIFSPQMVNQQRVPDRAMTRLLFFSRLSELEYLQTSLEFYEALFCTFEEYEVCFNIRYILHKIETTIAQKSLVKE
ncbi:hypothetical protein BH24BAC1_BH24BAC1_13360 [soil metagenome]